MSAQDSSPSLELIMAHLPCKMCEEIRERYKDIRGEMVYQLLKHIIDDIPCK